MILNLDLFSPALLILRFRFVGQRKRRKAAVQWLNVALCFVSNTVQVGSIVLRNRQLLIAANR